MAVPVSVSVDTVVNRLHTLLQDARKIKTEQDIVPPLAVSKLLNNTSALLNDTTSKTPYAIIEAAARHVFHQLLVSLHNSV